MSFNFHLVITGILALCLAITSPNLQCQENPYIVTYDHYLEEPGNLEIEYFSTFGTQRAANNFRAFWMEFEYGATAWWTTELYLDAQTTFGDSTVFTGVRWENRFRPLKYEHFINPVIYVEYEHKSAADKILKEVEGHDVESDYAPSNAVLRNQHGNEIETKLILSGTHKGWNFSENTLAAKNLSKHSMGIWICLGFESPPRAQGFRKTLFPVRAKFYCRCRDVWWLGRPLQLWTSRYFTLSGASPRLEFAI